MKPRAYFSMIKAALRDFFDDQCLRLGAALSYYAFLSLAPLLLVVLAIVGLVFGREAAGHRLVGEMRGLVGEQGAEVAQTIIASASRPNDGLLAMIVGIVMLLVGAAGVFAQLQAALNIIWE